MSIFLHVAAGFLCWTLLYHACCLLSPAKTPEWHCRIITVIHAVTVVIMSSWSCFVQGPWPFSDPGGPNTPYQQLTMTVCLTYFIFDFSWCLYHKTEGPFMIFHHALSITGLSLALSLRTYGTELMATIFGTEITNPFLQLRWILRKTGQGSTWYAELLDLFFMALFGVMRIIIGGHLLYCYLRNPRPDWLGRAGGISMYAVGWGFWFMIVRYAVKKYRGMWQCYLKGRELELNAVNGDVVIMANGGVTHRTGYTASD